MYIQSEISVSRLCDGKEQKGCIYPSSRKVEEESQEQTEETNFPKSRQKLGHSIKQSKGVHEGMAWILWNSGNEEHNGTMERVATPKNTNVYLEAMETAEDES